jgi:hypothetical protein
MSNVHVQILNNCQGPHYIQLPHTVAGGRGVGPIVVLHPGLNLVPAETFAEIKKNPGFAQLFDLKIKPSKCETADFRKFNRPMLEARGEIKQPVTELPIAVAKEIVELTENTDSLVQWLRDCPPKSVELIKTLKARITELSGQIDKDSKE